MNIPVKAAFAGLFCPQDSSSFPCFLDGMFWFGYYRLRPQSGAVVQLGERLTGSQEVVGSSPISSTSYPTFYPFQYYSIIKSNLAEWAEMNACENTNKNTGDSHDTGFAGRMHIFTVGKRIS